MGNTCTVGCTRWKGPEGKSDFNANYKLGKQIGIGSFGDVRKCKHKKTGAVFAVKIMKRQLSDPKMSNFQTANLIKSEMEILKSLDHPNIVRLHDFYDGPQFAFLVMEKCDGGELFHQIVKRRKFTEEDASVVCSKMIAALAYLHSHCIIHRDIKAENFLFKDKHFRSDVKLIDFGMAIRLEGNRQLSEVCGSPHYVSPELLMKSYDHSSDMWAFGVLLYLMLFGRYPFEGSKRVDIKKAILEKKINWKGAECNHLTDEAKEFLALLLERDVQKRLTASAALSHPWITSRSARKQSNIIGKQTLVLARRLSTDLPQLREDL
ncbi:CAM Kinase family, incomplete catalytic triad [Cardiosporidium cionae]|uniref:CAM Kinase family, incomplete catalytic triad n=1 Tax=Cardiosporidium cionae TaxID=476202 RepID=A0ABQ7JFL3_9APIC|nr:CAM Kinase family, incomplete catalytic triad [Cardiosporidium cionae]|eukprot:KAF8822777.1 CAM Kinase family, incomplete catalytic triad [Cardiosporidium cionae]